MPSVFDPHIERSAVLRCCERVAVLRALQLGDLLCAVPAFRALRASLPHAEITLVGLPWASTIVERFSQYLDAFLEFPGYPGLPERQADPERIVRFLTRVQAQRFDLVLQLQGNGTVTNPLVAMFGARRLAGCFRPGQFCPDPSTFMPYPESGLEIRRLLGLLEHLGIPSMGEELEFPLHERDSAELSNLKRRYGPGTDRYVCVHPGASTAARRWPAAAFASVARRLDQRGYEIVLTGTEAERDLTAAVGNEIPHVNLCGRTELGTLAALLANASLLVANDTGVSHLADALGIPSVIISTGNNPERWAPIDNRRHRVLSGEPTVSVAEVLREIDDLLQLSSLERTRRPRLARTRES